MRCMGKRVLRLNCYPLDKQDSAVKTVIEQAEALCEDWVGRVRFTTLDQGYTLSLTV
ncbi:MAG: DUF3387 domain-containing protein [bacterium]|nr:DUF3387 domain-containing protein [bacterium]